MPEPDHSPLPPPEPTRATAEPVLPGTWTLRRGALLLLLTLHWVAVLAHAVPDEAEPAGVPLGRWGRAILDLRLPLPVVDTHPGQPLLSIQDESVLTRYLTLSAQSQRWKMFTPRRQLVAAMTLEYRMEDGSTRVVRLADPARMSRLRWIRWRLAEWFLMSARGVHEFVPLCAMPLAKHLAPGPWTSVVLRKRFVPVPVLRESERRQDTILFTTSEDHAERVRELGRMNIATYPDLVLHNPDRKGRGTGGEADR